MTKTINKPLSLPPDAMTLEVPLTPAQIATALGWPIGKVEAEIIPVVARTYGPTGVKVWSDDLRELLSIGRSTWQRRLADVAIAEATGTAPPPAMNVTTRYAKWWSILGV